MKRKLFASSLVLCAALAMTGCQNEESLLQQQDGQISVQAVMGSGSRTAVDYDGKVTWTAGDAMLVYGNNVQGTLTLADEDAGKAQGTFRGTVAGDADNLTTAIYPASMADYDGSVTLTGITYPNSNAPMVADFGPGTLQFSHLAGMVRIKVNHVPADGENTLTLTADKAIAGKAVLNGKTLNTSGATGKEITVTIPANSHDGNLVVDVPVLVTDNQVSLTVKLNNAEYKGEGEAAGIAATLAVGKITASTVPALTYNAEGGTLTKVQALDEDAEADTELEETEGEYLISTPAELLGFAKNVNSGTTYEGKTVKLTADIDLANQPWTPIGLNADAAAKNFQGTFDGQGYVISNLKVVKGAAYEAAGFFGALNGTAKNFTIDGAYVEAISSGVATYNGIAVVAGSIYGTGNIEGVTVKNATVKGNRYVGGIAGYTYGNVKNCNVDNVELTATPDKLTGSYDNGDEVGAIVAAFWDESTYEVSGNTANNVTISGYRDMGVIAGFAYNAGAVKNNTVSGTNYITVDRTYYYEDKAKNANEVVGRIETGTLGENTVTGTVTIDEINNEVAELNEKLAEDTDVTLTEDVQGVAIVGNSYGTGGLTLEDDATLDGNGNTLDVSGANGDWDCAVYAKAGTVKNLTINGAFRGIFMGEAEGNVTVDNVVIDKVCYTFNSDGGNKNYGVYIKNSTLNGWTSYSDVHKEVKFTNCNFGRGTGGYKYAFCRPYNASVFTDCVFEEGFEFDTSKTSDITFENCYYGETLITAENAATLGDGETTFFYNGLNGITIK